MTTFTISAPNNDNITILVHDYERNVTGDFYDDNWLSVSININAGSFSGNFSANFITEELSSFSEQLAILYDKLIGQAIFSTIENQLNFSLTGNGTGNIQVSGSASDSTGNTLEFKFETDQTFLPKTLKQLSNVTKIFPTRTA